MPNKMYIIKISSNNLGQALDGLRRRAEAYRRTELYHKEGRAYDCDIEEVEDEVEAADIAEGYEQIIADLEGQIARQNFMEEKIDQHLSNTGGK